MLRVQLSSIATHNQFKFLDWTRAIEQQNATLSRREEPLTCIWRFLQQDRRKLHLLHQTHSPNLNALAAHGNCRIFCTDLMWIPEHRWIWVLRCSVLVQPQLWNAPAWSIASGSHTRWCAKPLIHSYSARGIQTQKNSSGVNIDRHVRLAECRFSLEQTGHKRT